MNILLKQISDSNSGMCKFILKPNVQYMPNMFACPMISMSFLDCISEANIFENMMAKQEFYSTSFYITNCSHRTNNKDVPGADVARTCPRFQNGCNCWDELTIELRRRQER
jgi:hypothetical protein